MSAFGGGHHKNAPQEFRQRRSDVSMAIIEAYLHSAALLSDFTSK
jgi:hypothetical protein